MATNNQAFAAGWIGGLLMPAAAGNRGELQRLESIGNPPLDDETAFEVDDENLLSPEEVPQSITVTLVFFFEKAKFSGVTSKSTNHATV